MKQSPSSLGCLYSVTVQLRAQMAVLSELCVVKKQERDKLQEKYREIEIKLSRAEVLMKSLGEEQVRTRVQYL